MERYRVEGQDGCEAVVRTVEVGGNPYLDCRNYLHWCLGYLCSWLD